jgi:hypothetical protein
VAAQKGEGSRKRNRSKKDEFKKIYSNYLLESGLSVLEFQDCLFLIVCL